ncbi:hypothetical protein ACWKWU_04595 [Chitinophaga lutea]
MRGIIIAGALALALAACNSGGGATKGDTTAAAEVLESAKPAGTLEVALKDRNKDTSAVTFTFAIDTTRYEKTFNDLPLMPGLPDTALYRVFWDQPNSVWIGFVKRNRDTRYYHGTQDGPLLKILWVPSPPQRIYRHIEQNLGLGSAVRDKPRMGNYSKALQSGRIVDTFRITLQRAEQIKDSVIVMAHFGGSDETFALPTPQGTKPYVQPITDELCYVGLEIEGEPLEVFEVTVNDGRLTYKQLRKIK